MNESVNKTASVVELPKQAVSISAREWGWIDREIWTESMLTALDNGVKGGKWFSLIDKVWRPETLRAAWQQVKANKGSAGVDRVSIERFASQEERYLNELEQALKEGRYHPQAVRRVEIPKADGKKRPLGIPTVSDRVLQTAVKRVIEPIFEKVFAPTSYGFRPGRGCKDALRQVDKLIKEGKTHVVDADLKSYFDSIPHERLMERLKEFISDGRLLELIQSWLSQAIIQGLERWTPVSGTPQGAVISPLLANLYLHDLDLLMAEHGYHMVRYADDFVIMCETAKQACQALEQVRRWVEVNGLSLHPDKTHVGDCRIKGQGFEFLGYHFEAGKRWVRKKSLKALKDKVRERTHRSNGLGLQKTIASLNPMLKGWFEYFKHANYYQFKALDGFIRRRLRSMLRKQEKRPGMGYCRADHSRWPNIFFARAGLFTLEEALLIASQSR